MNIQFYNKVSMESSKVVTRSYSNSFSLAIQLLSPSVREGIYSIYGFVRLADEIVDSFHDYDKELLLNNFEKDVDFALDHQISLNPVLNSFQLTARKYRIGKDLISIFLSSMKQDLYKSTYNKDEYLDYIFGSADVVGLMCLKVFTEGDEAAFERLKNPAMKLGSAFQKVNFLRDIKNDFEKLDRKYFPEADLKNFTQKDKQKIVSEIENDFKEAYKGIVELPVSVRMGVYTAYLYYHKLLKKLKRIPPAEIMERRIRIPGYSKLSILAYSYLRFKLYMG